MLEHCDSIPFSLPLASVYQAIWQRLAHKNTAVAYFTMCVTITATILAHGGEKPIDFKVRGIILQARQQHIVSPQTQGTMGVDGLWTVCNVWISSVCC
jgi:hypothetical protein